MDLRDWYDEGPARKARAEGVPERVIALGRACLAHLPEVLDRQAGQPEFSLSIRTYLGRVMPPERVAEGRDLRAAHEGVLTAIEARYGVPRDVVLAIWGMETRFGAVMGDVPVIAALATLGRSGARAAFFEGELVAALGFAADAGLSPADLTGSWAGAMGHGQFMPSSARAFAVDFDGDGRCDLWGADPVDALASIAAYLAAHGWQRGAPWGAVLPAPAPVDPAMTGRGGARPTEAWRALGVPLDPAITGEVALLLPAGHTGPAIAAGPNFSALLSYNRAVAYALGVGLLSEAIGGAGEAALWPDVAPLTRGELREAQRLLTERGFDTFGADGLTGPNTEAAIRAFQTASGRAADGFADAGLLAALRS